MKILVTGARGFIGKNLLVALKRRPDWQIVAVDLDSPPSALTEALAETDIIYHLAGVNRPQKIEEFKAGNFDLTRQICDELVRIGRAPSIVLCSSTQAILDNPYGCSKKLAEEAVLNYASKSGASVFIFRLPGVFGKWCRPNYNSVVATFCHNIARGLPITISDPEREVELVYIDDVVRAFSDCAEGRIPFSEGRFSEVKPNYKLSLGVLAETLQSFSESRSNLKIPDMSKRRNRALYATYLSYLPPDSFAYSLTQNVDPRGELAELMKSQHVGQIFVSRTRPGITRGNHYHDTKVEKFMVLEGEAVIRFRHILGGEVIEYSVSGHEFRVVDIPPGYTHSIKNVGSNDMIVLFWACEIFSPGTPDTFGFAV
jgi:UDP-2-acetamido-2,6-beta-L-arabino-hexul-4-ose reductase